MPKHLRFLIPLVLVLVGLAPAQPAAARWIVHNGNDATEVISPFGELEEEVCSDQLRGQASWADPVIGEPLPTHPVSPWAFRAVTYELFKAPPGSWLEWAGDGMVYYKDGTYHRATLVKSFTTAPRARVTRPFPVNNSMDVITTSQFNEDLIEGVLANISPGDRLALRPFPELTGSTIFDQYTTVDCGDRGFMTDWRGTWAFCRDNGAALHVADFNGDSRDDLLCRNSMTGDNSVAYAAARGGFEDSRWQRRMDFCSRSGDSLRTDDYNRDGRSDLLCHSRRSGVVAIDYSTSSGRFSGADWQTALGFCAGSATKLYSADFNGDRRGDLLCHNPMTGRGTIALAATGGRFAASGWTSTAAFCARGVADLHTADHNGDGRSDLLCHNATTGRVSIAYARARGRFVGTDWQRTMPFCTTERSQLQSGDFNADGRSDMLCHDPKTLTERIAFATPGGSFRGTDWERTMGICTRERSQLGIGDFDGDARSDILCHDAASALQEISYSDL